MEVCGGSHHWARKLTELGHTVKLIAAQFVKPFVKNNKNDARDAEAICEAINRPDMIFVSIKSFEQHDIQSLHRIRELTKKTRTSLVNQIRGILMEYGVVIPQGISHIRNKMPLILEDAENELTSQIRRLLADLYEYLHELDTKVKSYDCKIECICKEHDICKRLSRIEGVGAITATALYSSLGTGHQFKKGRDMSAWIGLVPKQRSSGGKARLGSISKRGNVNVL